jgi:hypothetical protein
VARQGHTVETTVLERIGSTKKAISKNRRKTRDARQQSKARLNHHTPQHHNTTTGQQLHQKHLDKLNYSLNIFKYLYLNGGVCFYKGPIFQWSPTRGKDTLEKKAT